jgi:ComF family protein
VRLPVETWGMFVRDKPIVNQLAHLRLTGAHRLSRLLAATVFPPKCCLCGFPGMSLDLDLCGFCRADLPWLGEGSSETVVALQFAPPVDEMIRDLKYHGVIAHARVLGVLLAQTINQRGGELPRLLVPVPLHESRFRERGFNQSAALARYAGRILNIPYSNLVVRRVWDTPSQTSLSEAERHRNVRGAFAVGGARAMRRLSGADHVAVVDDVMTTGSTAAELKRTLLDAGVPRVDIWAVAKVAVARAAVPSQASPAFFNASRGGPSKLASGTLPT